MPNTLNKVGEEPNINTVLEASGSDFPHVVMLRLLSRHVIRKGRGRAVTPRLYAHSSQLVTQPVSVLLDSVAGV